MVRPVKAPPAREASCPVCGDVRHATLFAEANFDATRLDRFAYASRKPPEYMHHRLLVCRECDVAYASPRPQRSALESAYRAAAYDSQAEAALAARTYRHALEPHLATVQDRAGALDIGAGDGAFLRELLALGFRQVRGIEPSAAPVAAAADDLRPLIVQGMFAPGQFAAESLALVTCFQTIEHVDDPLELCREALRLLRPGGLLCLVGHNRRALSARVLGRRSPIFDLEHLQLFSPRGFDRLLAAAGFERVRIARLWNVYPLSYWTRLFPFPAPFKRGLAAGLRATGAGRMRLTLPAGNLMVVGARPAC